MLLTDFLPAPALIGYVRRYQVFRFVFDRTNNPPYKYHVPRPEHCLTFYIRDNQTFSHVGSGQIITYPRCIIHGLQTLPIIRYGSHDFWAVKVVLQPTALYRLTGLFAHEVTNTFIDAEAIWGSEIRQVSERLCSTDNLPEMVRQIELFLVRQINRVNRSPHALDKVSQLIVSQDSWQSTEWLADQSCMSLRQFMRKFDAEVGISPKLLNRINRFDRAWRLKNQNPDLDWLSIALVCGYYDYQHLTKDFKEFSLLTPVAYYEQDQQGPERAFGLSEL